MGPMPLLVLPQPWHRLHRPHTLLPYPYRSRLSHTPHPRPSTGVLLGPLPTGSLHARRERGGVGDEVVLGDVMAAVFSF